MTTDNSKKPDFKHELTWNGRQVILREWTDRPYVTVWRPWSQDWVDVMREMTSRLRGNGFTTKSNYRSWCFSGHSAALAKAEILAMCGTLLA